MYYENKMRNSKGLWNSLKNLMSANKIQTPRRLNISGETITSPKKISELMQNFFIEKINMIKETFVPATVDPIYLLSKLIPKPDTEFKLKEITIKETKDIIRTMKNTNTVGFDRISSRVLKLSIDICSILITHAINVSIRESKFPSSMKIARVIPILKPTKIKTNQEGYRPICNLHSIEKVYEEHLKRELTKYFK